MPKWGSNIRAQIRAVFGMRVLARVLGLTDACWHVSCYTFCVLARAVLERAGWQGVSGRAVLDTCWHSVMRAVLAACRAVWQHVRAVLNFCVLACPCCARASLLRGVGY